MTLLEQWWAVYRDMEGKHTRHDWHGVRDACVDLEGIEIRMRERGEEFPVRARRLPQEELGT
jgi:hypothetical protein